MDAGRIVRELGVEAEVHDIGWAVPDRAVSDELLVMAWRKLGRFLDDLSPYEIEIVDVGSRPSPDGADELALVVNTHDAGDPLLPPAARVAHFRTVDHRDHTEDEAERADAARQAAARAEDPRVVKGP
ncbi:hypothetical protein [Thermomonospora amylolytica]|uniref:hypothetical protein n=1 Tax=Thermomonospora amylolytica TaxID=1411117 RepID=UPI000E6C507A|nr:hypothetical protein [Thermomonospora amylolytica]